MKEAADGDDWATWRVQYRKYRQDAKPALRNETLSPGEIWRVRISKKWQPNFSRR